MDQGQVLLVNLAKGHIGEDSSSLLGALLVTTIGLAAFSRADTPPAERRDFFVYIDEFQSFTTLALANMFSEMRKYRVGFTVAHQYLNQLEPDERHAVLGNAGSIVVSSWRRRRPIFSSGIPTEVRGARSIAASELPHLSQALDGMPSKPFSAKTLAPTIPQYPRPPDI
jgi:hypothetical protein